MPQPVSASLFDFRKPVLSGLCVLGGVVSQAMSWQTILSSESMVSNMLSAGRWRSTVECLGGRMIHSNSGGWLAEVDFLPLALVGLVVAAVSGLVAGVLVRRTTRASWSDSLTQAGFAFGWWWLMGVWELSRLLAFGIGFESLEHLLLVSPHFWMSVALAGWLVHPFAVSSPLCPSAPLAPTRRAAFISLAVLIAIYIIIFTALNWQLWFNLRIPHGDSAMYEEHLWNLTHGKGFRSYLDQGLFLGEHIQVVHLLLLPLHWLWPSHLLLELCESTALALGAIPVFRMARRSTGSDRAALLLAGAYLWYFPLHFLDIEVDLKTFRPESFCVPFFLFAFDQLEQGRLRRVVVLLLFALSAKEDYSIIIAPLGVWIAARAWLSWKAESGERKAEVTTKPAFRFPLSAFWPQFIFGLCVAVFAVAYLVVATRVVIPWFRGGAELHYVKYFSKFGDSMEQIAWNMLTKPGLLFGELITVKTIMYGVSMLLPVGFVSLLSPSRLTVGLPLFGILCLNELARDPQHHFHAPLVPVVFWAAAVGVGRAGTVANKLMPFLTPTPPHPVSPSLFWSADSFARQFVWTSAFASGLFLSMSPAGISFWDSHSSLSLWRLYVHDPRADQFPKVFAQIPRTARVASTDFVHPRFTHHERAYDYSHYRRRVAGYEDRIPDDTDFIVIDTQHPYSQIKSPDQVRELRQEPDDWELLPDETDGYFIVLRRSLFPNP